MEAAKRLSLIRAKLKRPLLAPKPSVAGLHRATELCLPPRKRRPYQHPKDWEGAEKLRQRALKDGGISGTFTVVLYDYRYDSQSAGVMAELIGYSRGESPS